AANIDNYCARYPQMGTLLRTELETVDQIDRTLADATDVTTNAEELPARLSGHRILGELGSGGMGRVLLAHDEALDRTVAIKVLDRKLNENEELRTRFMREARATARITHPNIVRIYNLGSPAEVPHFVMEYVHGTNLT